MKSSACSTTSLRHIILQKHNSIYMMTIVLGKYKEHIKSNTIISNFQTNSKIPKLNTFCGEFLLVYSHIILTMVLWTTQTKI